MRQVGDRYFTDVVYGNQSGMLTIRVMPFTEKGETVVVKAVRALEDWVVRLWRDARRHARRYDGMWMTGRSDTEYTTGAPELERSVELRNRRDTVPR